MNQLSLPSRRRILDDASAGLGSARGPHISVRGGRFRFVTASNERFVQTHHLDIIVVDANKFDARVFFDGPFDPNNMEVPPACFSDNGTGPSRDAIAPQAPTCAQCPQNVRGSDVTFTGKATTACTKRKKLGVIEPDSADLTVYEFAVPPGSLTNFKAYTNWLGQQNHPSENRPCDICDVVTRVEFDPQKPFVMQFSCSAWADDEPTVAKVEQIFQNDLGAAAVGRNDVAIDPQSFGMLPRPAAPAEQMIRGPDPRPTQAQQAPQQALPPRQAPQQLTAPQQMHAASGASDATRPMQQVPPKEPKAPRSRKSAEKAEKSEPSAATAPFMAPAATSGPSAAAPSPAPQPAPAGNNPDIPAFLRRTEEAAPNTGNGNGAAPTPRFGIGQAPPPPAEIMSAVANAMNLPSRK